MNPDALVQSICDQNLAVYRASPIRLREDVGQEAEIAHDYRGRLVYELLQNADDAMADSAAADDTILLRLTDTDLWVGNSGRPLNEDDVRGLCGIGASSKGGAVNRKRASIGHKGMGFKSVLEITEAPEVMSETCAFRLGRHLAQGPVTELMEELGEDRPSRVPAMRFPAMLDELPPQWTEVQASGLRTLFRFPLRQDLSTDQRAKLADRLVELPVTAILFLKHLERIEVDVATSERSERFRWTLKREISEGDSWVPIPGLSRTGLYRVNVEAEHASDHTFLVAHDDNLEIEDHRGGLDEYAWNGVELSEVSVAVRLVDELPGEIDSVIQVLHVFLPTSEACPYPLIINGAFSADLSRQEVRVAPDPHDYNGWLLSQAARVVARELVPALLDRGVPDSEVFRLLDRGASEPDEAVATPTGQALVAAIRTAFSSVELVPTPTSSRRAPGDIIVPPLTHEGEAGTTYRALLDDNAEFKGHAFPLAELCSGRSAFVLADLGAAILEAEEAPRVLAQADLSTVELEVDDGERVWVDPVLRALEQMWSGLTIAEQTDFEHAVREVELFPTDGEAPSELHRVAVADRDCFYPPRALSGSIPLDGLCFLSRDLCWGDLQPKERQEALRGQFAVWQALFGVREFKFPDVVRSSVLPALTLPDEGGRAEEWTSLCKPEVLAAVCQLSGRTPNPTAPLPYERLGPNRALFNLARLPVPCRADDSGELTWQPAYRVYFGKDWIGEDSVEMVTEAIGNTGAEAPDVPFLAGPDLLEPLLERYEDLRRSAEEDTEEEEDDEVDLDEDEEEALDSAPAERWLSFLTWLGVNHALRPVHFSDVEDRQTGWLTTKDLTRPHGWAFQRLDDDVWAEYESSLRSSGAFPDGTGPGTPYYYEVHDLEFLPDVLSTVADDAECRTAQALLAHLVHNWRRLRRFSDLKIAVVEAARPSARNPPRATDDELRTPGDNLWLHRLRRRDFLPTTHGPKRPGATWMPTRELDRRFSSRRGNLKAGQLLPILDVDDELLNPARPVCSMLGVRDEITPSSFGPQDARLVVERLASLFGHGSANGERAPDKNSVREVIRPTYRNLIELLPGRDADARYPEGVLADAPLLEDNGAGEWRFVPSTKTLWADRNGTRERLGNPSDLWTFVLDASAGPRIPLTRLLKVRVLEEQLHWEPEPGDPLEDPELGEFRGGMRRLAPFILARLSADRATETLQQEDALRMRRLLDRLTPVHELYVACRLDGRALTSPTRRPAFVDIAADAQSTQAFVKWDDVGWPPSPSGAEALATALAECFGAGHFEAFLALVSAPDDPARRRLLALAGAPSDVEPFSSSMAEAELPEPEEPPSPDESLGLPKEAGAETNEQSAQPLEPGSDGSRLVMNPLYEPGDLLVEGAPVALSGDGAGGNGTPGKTHSSTSAGRIGSTKGYGGRTDLSTLDALGMFVSVAYEVNRLRAYGLTQACQFDPNIEEPQEEACVFDVSSAPLIALASERSDAFREALSHISARGIDRKHPGCDILTLRPGGDQPIDRLIELKSSGQHARTQAMTWNEWKTAQTDELRSHFYLYLVGNLRSDLPDATPFLRTVRDPYATIRAQEHVDHSVTRRVTLRVEEFEHAEHLELGVVRDAAAADQI